MTIFAFLLGVKLRLPSPVSVGVLLKRQTEDEIGFHQLNFLHTYIVYTFMYKSGK